MPTTIEHIESIVAKAGDLAETKAEIVKLKAAGKISETVSSIISLITIVTLIGLALTIVSLGAAYFIGKELGNVYYGLFIMGGFYCLAAFIIYRFRRTWIRARNRDRRCSIRWNAFGTL